MAFRVAELHRHSVERPWTYADLDRRQQDVRAEVLAGGRGRLIFSEVAPVVTLGFRNTEEDLLLSPEALAAKGISVLGTSRGGCATYHGPGQWVAFPIESLERLVGDRKGVRETTERLFDAALVVAREKYPRAEVREGRKAGVWTDRGAKAGKLVSLGLRFEGGVLQHGIALNVFPTKESFHGIRPCGLDAAVAFLEDEADTSFSAAANEEKFFAWGERFEAALLERFPAFLRIKS
jgi:lipoyl(octanoyl) transferase